jgi:hypothetical protein
MAAVILPDGRPDLTRLELDDYLYPVRALVPRRRPRHWLPAHRGRRLGVQAVVIDPSAVFRKALWIGQSCTVVSVDTFHLVLLVDHAVIEAQQRPRQELRGPPRTGGLR